MTNGLMYLTRVCTALRRKLVEKLEADAYAGLEIAHPCTEHFGPKQVDGDNNQAEEAPQHVLFYVGCGAALQNTFTHTQAYMKPIHTCVRMHVRANTLCVSLFSSNFHPLP
jgi:hypothetical protein